MLNWVQIKNLALVEDVDIEFEDNFNVITGETGAGKSVIIGSLGLLLGERADKGAIRSGTDRCEINGGISLEPDTASRIHSILESAGIEIDLAEEIQLRRIITPKNTRNFICDNPVNLQTLKAVGDCLIDIHGANEHQSLFSPKVQLEILDRYGKLDSLVNNCADIAAEIKKVREQRDQLDSNLPSPVEAEHLRLIISEIEKINPQPGEDQELSSRHAIAANARQVLETASRSVNLLNEADSSLADQLAELYRNLQDLEKIDPTRISPFIEQCEQLIEGVRELAYDLEAYGNTVELNESEFQELETRLSDIQTLKRRYGPGLDDVFDSMENSRIRLKKFENSADLRKQLDDQEDLLYKKLSDTAGKLSKSRKKAAVTMTKAVIEKLRVLGFLKAEFSVDFSVIEAGANGNDQIDFLFCPNPGEAPKPLRQIASSGEISRLMLALKTVLAAADEIPILVFDEIDVNIGGKTAVRVGEELQQLAKTHQLLCISHLPSVAAHADTHLLVEKSVKGNRTTTRVEKLDPKQRKQEITRMLGDTKAAGTHAKELLQNAEKNK